jgi:hypothetical protein
MVVTWLSLGKQEKWLQKLSPVIISEEIVPHATLICKGGTALNKVFLKDIQRGLNLRKT